MTSHAFPDHTDEELSVLVHNNDTVLLEQDHFHQRAAPASPESPDRKELFRLGFKNYDIISLHLDHDRTVRRYDLCLDIAKRRREPDFDDKSSEELKQPLTAYLDANSQQH